MTWSDPIVDEVRRSRDAYAARFNYDLRAIFRDLKEQEKRSGRKLVSYAQDAPANSPDQSLQPTEKTSKSYLTGAEKKALGDQLKSVTDQVRAAFEAAFSAWKDTWFSGGLAISSNPHTRAVGKEFDTLIALGPAILPLVVEKLADPENFLALQLYDAMQPNERLVVQFEPEDERILEGEQGRARRVVQAWFANQ